MNSPELVTSGGGDLEPDRWPARGMVLLGGVDMECCSGPSGASCDLERERWWRILCGRSSKALLRRVSEGGGGDLERPR